MAFSAAGAVGAFPAVARAQHEAAVAERVVFEVPGLDPAHDGLRVAQLSDLHVGPQTSPAVVRSAIEEANRFQPDLVALTGDYLSHSRDELDAMRELLGGLAAPTVAVLGNHDVWVDPEGAAAVLRLHGYEVLDNSWMTVRLRGVRLPIVGIIENMSGLVCPHCGETIDVFKRGGGETAAKELGLRFLGRVPLDPQIVMGGDAGKPFVLEHPDSPAARAFEAIVKEVRAGLKPPAPRPSGPLAR